MAMLQYTTLLLLYIMIMRMSGHYNIMTNMPERWLPTKRSLRDIHRLQKFQEHN